ncbi:hypothetical protein JYU34_002126 [Plutella xylostella]|uniref:Uncharacterized protein n=1 Tax=Plutella xylostella TaxID=51655 RepID=A0ABQ7R1H2_PLUXY|nr:hypothetical protein JYU34_002126 [Plutella xylostella]
MEGKWFFPFGMVKAVLVSPHRKNPENSRRRDTLQAKGIDKDRRIPRNKKILKYKKPKEAVIRVINYTDLVSPDNMTPSPSAFVTGKPEESSSFVVPSVDAGLSDP